MWYSNENMTAKSSEVVPRSYEPLWSHITVLLVLHLTGLYGSYLLIYARFYTLLFTAATYEMSVLGVTAASHRLWAHNSFKAKLPLKLLLVFWQTMGQQGSVIGWCHNHRVHHKYTDTDADPHNARRGLFFSHVGWLLVQYHPEVLEKRKTIDMSDLTSDPILAFQKKHFIILMPLICFVLPSVIPVYFWGEDIKVSIFVNVFRYLVVVHSAFTINSWAHAFGTRPYDRHILASESLLCSIVSQGEGWHNYHHAFPWDYKASELGSYGSSWTTAFIDLMAKIGWAYDLKTASSALVKQRIEKKGDGTHPVHKNPEQKE